MMYLNYITNFFIWFLRALGILPVADGKKLNMLCVFLTVFHMLFFLALTIIPQVLVSNNLKTAVFWFYIGVAYQLCKISLRNFYFISLISASYVRNDIALRIFFIQFFFTVFGIAHFINCIETLIKRKELILLMQKMKNLDHFSKTQDEREKKTFILKHFGYYMLFVFFGVIFGSVVAGGRLTYFLMMMYTHSYFVTRSFQYIIVCDIVFVNLKSLNNEIVFLNKTKHTDPKTIKEKLIQFRDIYEKLNDITRLINYVCSYSVLSFSILNTFSFIGITYWILIGFLKNIQLIGPICK